MASNQRPKVAYGLSQPNFGVGPIPVTTLRDPLITDFAEIGTLWINKASDKVWVLTSIVLNQAVWTEIDNQTTNVGITWYTDATVGPIALAVNSGYYLTNAAAVATTLPLVSTIGSQIILITSDASAALAGFTITQNANQYIVESANSSTIGVGGSLDATNQLQESITMQLICTVANIEWTVFSTNINPRLI